MTIDEHLTEFAGRPVVDFTPGQPLPDLTAVALRVTGGDWDDFEAEQLVRLLEPLAAAEGSEALESLVLGWWGSVDTTSEPAVTWLAEHAASFPALRCLFVGDITMEENEMSWINQCDLRPLLAAFPGLTHLGTRGTVGLGDGALHLGPVSLPELRWLAVESGGLPREVVAEVLGSSFPKLDHLELWLGTDEYGATVTMDDLEPLFTAPPFPLTSLALRNADLTDAIAVRLATAPVVAQLSRVDLSLGTLTDEGGEALLASPAIAELDHLDLHRHFLSTAVAERLAGLSPVVVDVSDQEEPDEYDGEVYRYVAVGE